MKTKILTLTAILVCIVIGSDAQEKIKTNPCKKAPTNKCHSNVNINPFTHSKTVPFSINKSRSGARLMAESSVYLGSMDIDSSHYAYNGTNYGWDPTPYFMENWDANTRNLWAEQFATRYQNIYDMGEDYNNMFITDSFRIIRNQQNHVTKFIMYDIVNNIRLVQSFTYGPNNTMIQMTDSFFQGSVLINCSRSLLTYTPLQRLQSMQNDTLDLSNFVWNEQSKECFYYNGANLLSKDVFLFYNPVTTSWDTSYQSTHLYNPANKIQTDSFFIWQNNTWVWFGIATYDYDIFNRLKQKIDDVNTKDTFEYSGNNPNPSVIKNMYMNAGNWIANSKEKYQFNAGNQMTIDSSFSYDPNSSTWEWDMRTKFYYESFNPSSIPNTINEEADLSIYPIPTSNNLFVDYCANENALSRWQLLSIDGRLIEEGINLYPNQGRLQLNLNHVPSGIYLLKLVGNQGSYSRRIIKD